MAEDFGLNKVVQEINYVTKQMPQVKSKEDVKRKLKLIVQSGFRRVISTYNHNPHPSKRMLE